MQTTTAQKVIGKFTFKRGVHPPHRKKFSQAVPIQPITIKPGQIFVVPMSQHLGAPNSPTVEKKQQVTAGQEVGNAEAFVSAPVHSPVNGTVTAVEPRLHPTGRKVLSVVITADQEQPQPPPWKELTNGFDLEKYAPEQIIDAAGL